MRLAVSILIILAPLMIFGQKNVVPVSSINLLGVPLPEGSTRDNRNISIAAASTLLKLSTTHKNLTFSPVEVYYLAAIGAGGYDAGQLVNLVSSNGSQVVADPGDKQLMWAINQGAAYLIYYSAEADKCDLYIGKSNKNPFAQIQQVAHQQTASTIPENPAGNTVEHPDYIPPLAPRRSAPPVQSENKPSETNEVFDLDGYRYSIIKIGDKYWFGENLRTTQYNDTTFIATGLNAEQWSKTKSGAYAIYDDKPENREKYGLLYNGYAVASGKLCPKGWHIATDADWKELGRFFGIPENELDRTGDRGNIADKLKTADNWQPSSFPGNNSSGFSILPAGTRNLNGEYTTLHQYGNFWTSTVYDDRYGLLYLWNHHINYNTNAVGRVYTLANNGYSCRCVKN